jgi:hypothetical protein
MKPCARYRRSGEDNIKIDVKKVEYQKAVF